MKRLKLIFILFLIITSWAWAENYYVSKMGSDSNPGTEAEPWLTIQKAANTLTAGDTVYIKEGTYKGRVVPKNSGNSGNYITYIAYSNDTVTIDGTGVSLPSYWGGLLEISGKDYIKISGFIIRNAGPDDNNQGILVDKCNYIIIENNYTYKTTSSGIGVWNSSNIIIDSNEVEQACNDGEQECITVAVTDTFVVKNNHVHDGGPGTIGGEGIDAKDGSSNGKIYNNHVHDLNRLGIYVDAWDKPTYNIEVYNNIVHDINDNDCFTLASESGGLLENINIYNNIGYNAKICGLTVSRNGESSTHPMKNITVINNTFYNNGNGDWGGGIAVDNPDIQSLVIRNNILSQNLSFQMEVEQDVSMQNLTVDHNLIHGFRNYEEEIKGNNYVEGDPLFVNTSSADFHLQEDSPAINTGSSNGAPSTDYEGTTRPQGSGYDIGSYEYKSGGSTEPEISLSRTNINFSALYGSTTPVIELFTISTSGTGILTWSVADDAAWLSANPTSGTDSATVTVTVDPSSLSIGSYTGIVTVRSTNASNSPQTITVNLIVKSSAQDEEPFGQFDSPVNGACVRGSIPVTGWALDDVVVESVKIYRDPVSGEGSELRPIGNAVLVEGARPDIEIAFPGYPNNSRAGWGYMLLTNFLPNSGNGTFTLYAVAADGAGHEVTLDTKTITCDNVNAVKPFGAIDTPGQGGTVSGSNYLNWGWVLTPQLNKIPTDGSTINVYVDGVNLGHPGYNRYREDIATKFPGYANSNGAIGLFPLDTTAYENGVHTIQWTAEDNAGNKDGIGSRYFTILNSHRAGSVEHGAWSMEHGVVCMEHGVKYKKGYDLNANLIECYPDDKGKLNIEIKELERIEIHLGYSNSKFKIQNSKLKNTSLNQYSGYLIVGNQLRPLPIGSNLDNKRGIFSWQPGPGFIGEYKFIFLTRGRSCKAYSKNLTIEIVPKFSR